MKDNNRYFIITVDTEGDNLWNWKEGDEVKTENVNYLKRFEDLSNKYGFKPVYLSNWEMLNDERFVEFAKKEEKLGNCEIGMHIHAWNNPPFYQLNIENKDSQPYLIEYPKDIMEQKIDVYLDFYKKLFNRLPISHRAGRWAMNNEYFNLLKKKGIKIDCSYTPYVDWSNTKGQTKGSKGLNYSKATNDLLDINGVKEIPTTIMKRHNMCFKRIKNFKTLLIEIYNFVFGRIVWLRPDNDNLDDMKWIVKKNLKKDNNYIMFMIHSSELMPGGSPHFKDEKEIEKLYKNMEELFIYASKDYRGVTLSEYITE